MSGDSICPKTKYEICLWPFQQCDPVWTSSSWFNSCISVLSAHCVHIPFYLSHQHLMPLCLWENKQWRERKKAHTHTGKNRRAGIDAAGIQGWLTQFLDRHHTFWQHRAIHQVLNLCSLLSILFPEERNWKWEATERETQISSWWHGDMTTVCVALSVYVCI